MKFRDSESVRLAVKMFSASAKTHKNDDEFDHLIEYALTCTLEKDFEDVSRGSELWFKTINEVIDVGRLRLH